ERDDSLFSLLSAAGITHERWIAVVLKRAKWREVSKIVGARSGESNRRHERRSFRIIFSLQLPPMRFDDGTDAIQAETIMALADPLEWFPPPILRSRIKGSFWLMEGEQETVVTDFGSCKQCAAASIVPESVGEELHKHFL